MIEYSIGYENKSVGYDLHLKSIWKSFQFVLKCILKGKKMRFKIYKRRKNEKNN